jgi:hypothetical protein
MARLKICILLLSIVILLACTKQSTLEISSAALSYLGTYGTPFQSDSLNNFRVGYELNSALSFRFTASKNGSINAVRWYNIFSLTRPGYHGGNGGTLQIQIRSDDNSALHAPSGTVLASATITNLLQAGGFPVLRFNQPVNLTAGQLYHIVFTNIDPNPTVNYVSVNQLWMNPQVPSNFDVSYDFQSMIYYPGQGWSNYRDIPIFEVYYTDGSSQGQGYMEVWVGNPKPISYNNERVRQTFTVSTKNRLASKVSFRIRKVATGGDLILRLENADGSLIEGKTFAQTTIPTTYSWITYTFSSPKSLVVGKTYRVVFSSTGTGKYEMYALADGSVQYGFTNSSLFKDGYAQFDKGSGWTGWDQWGSPNRKDGDLQLYFTVSQ